MAITIKTTMIEIDNDINSMRAVILNCWSRSNKAKLKAIKLCKGNEKEMININRNNLVSL
ncbi:hypothetical protein VEE58_16720 [Escherichia coli]|nr:hypothetical protein VEE58_16720 [Escherichia coli]